MTREFDSWLSRAHEVFDHDDLRETLSHYCECLPPPRNIETEVQGSIMEKGGYKYPQVPLRDESNFIKDVTILRIPFVNPILEFLLCVPDCDSGSDVGGGGSLDLYLVPTSAIIVKHVYLLCRLMYIPTRAIITHLTVIIPRLRD